MLTIRGTLQLNSLTTLKTSSDMLSRKIPGNYQLMGASVTAQDLLHMTMLPPEIYVQEGSEGNVSVSRNVTVANELRLNLVNNFFNRIMLLNTQDFTYQDEVFVSWFLRKIGITGTAEFISQVQKLTEQNVHITSLTEQYQTAKAVIHSLAAQLLELQKEPAPEAKKRETPAREARYFLQQEIFKRLHTSFVNHFIYDTRKYVSQAQTFGQETVLSEQLQMADTIRLSELKQLVLMEEQPPMHRQFRFYEQIPIPKEQVIEKTVMKYLGAAVLTNFISQMSYFLLKKQENRPTHWADYHRAFYGSSENTLKRFIELHEEQYNHYRNDGYMEVVNQLYRNEEHVLELFNRYQSRQTEEIYPAYQMVHTLFELQNQEKQAEELLYQKVLPPMQESKAGLLEEQPGREILTVLGEAEQRLRQQSGQLPYLLLPQSGQIQKEIEPLKERKNRDMGAAMETASPSLGQHTYNHTYQETMQKQFFTEADFKGYLDEINEKNIYKQTLLNNTKIEKQPLFTIGVDRKTAMQKSLEALKQPEKVLKEMLSQGHPIKPMTNPEIERLLSLAEEPVRKLYQQILYPQEAGTALQSAEPGAQEELAHPVEEFQMVPAEPEQLCEILREVENHSRVQTVTRISEDGDDPEEVKEHLVREIQTITRESRRAVSNLVWQPSVQHLKEALPLQYVHARVQANVEQGVAGVPRTAVVTGKEPSPVNLIFKREQAPLEEEVIEQMTRNSQVVNRQQENTAEMIKNSTVMEEKLKETRQEILVENRKNITELIQRSLQTQMSAISDQVYQNLERRLFNERKRRGY